MIVAKRVSGILMAASFVLVFNACSSDKQDDASLEAKDPVEDDANGVAYTDSTKPDDASKAAAPVATVSPPTAPVAAVPPPGPTPPTASDAAGISGPVATTAMHVMYVKKNNTMIYSLPNVKSRLLGRFEKGDHVLVASIDGDWAKTDTGFYIKANALSDKGIGRKKTKSKWSGSNSEE